MAATKALTRLCDGAGELPKRETCRLQTASDVMVRLKGPCTPSHIFGDVCGSTYLGSCAGTYQMRDQQWQI